MIGFFDTISSPMDTKAYLICTAVSLMCGLIVALASSYKGKISKSFLSCLVLLPFAVQTVIIMVNGSIGTGIAVAGAFSLVRFRSVPGKAKDIVSIFIAMTAGITCSAGYIWVALMFTVISSACMIAVMSIKIQGEYESELKITIPENLNFTGVFDDIFSKYTKRVRLKNVKTANMGSLYKLTYIIEMRNEDEIKDFIDELRCRNGNLEICIVRAEASNEEL